MEFDHLLFFQPGLQLTIVGNWDHTSPAVVEKVVQILATGNRRVRGVALTAQGEEKRDHVLWLAMLALFHVGGYSSGDRIFSVKTESRVCERSMETRERTLFSREVGRRHLNLCSASLVAGIRDEPVPSWGLEEESLICCKITYWSCKGAWAYIVLGFI